MKNRNRAQRRRRWSARKNLPNLFAERQPRKRKSFTFETLEPRLAFSIAPLELPTTSLSSDTPEGMAAIFLRELQWAALQSSNSGGTSNASALAFSLPTDPYFPDQTDPTQPGQWHLLNVGQPVGNPDFQLIYGAPGEDINVVPAWNLGYSGEGVIVAVLDDGIQYAHPDLLGNLNTQLGYNAFTHANNGNPPLNQPSHGTAVAGLIGATWSNEAGIPVTGGVGVAPEVTLVPIKMLGDAFTTYNGETPVINAFRYALMIGADITNNSWGPSGVVNGAPRTTGGPTPEEIQLLRDTVVFGRDGLGMINVFATGNNGGPGAPAGFAGFGNYSSSAYNGFINSRYIIGVTGIDHDGMYANSDGTFTSYPMAGPNVFVAAPTGSNLAQNVADDTGQGSGLWTTDLTGDFGYNAAVDPITGIDDDRDFLADPNYTSRFNGTSAAAPLVSGVIALMLDANPNLTYRDVQEILVRSARWAAPFEIPAESADPTSPFSSSSSSAGGSALSAGYSASGGGGLSAGSADLPEVAAAPPGFDFGDAPTSAQAHLHFPAFFASSYPTIESQDGARHGIVGNNFYLGSNNRDDETDGQPTEFADGDDDEGSDDETSGTNGINIPPLTPGGNNDITVNAPNGGVLNAWFDFNRDGDWNDPNERVITDRTLTNGNNTITISVPSVAAGLSLGTTFARFRLNSSGGLSPTGLATDGEVEDHQVRYLDFGDAPTADQSGFANSYPTTEALDGARHLVGGNNLRLGLFRDADFNGQPNSGATGDNIDNTPPNDEDGVVIPLLRPSQTAKVQIFAPNGGTLNAWIDFNKDGVWDPGTERVITDRVLTNGANEIDIIVPSGISAGQTFARFRLASVGGLQPTGLANDGEVEDYRVTIQTQSTGGGGASFVSADAHTTWQTNQMTPFRDPDSWPTSGRSDSVFDPIADPTLRSSPRTTIPFIAIPSIGNDLGRIAGHYELQPAEFTNGAGYTVSQGYGLFGELVGYGHGVIDAELAVRMARDWHTFNQDIAPRTEKTFTTFLSTGSIDLPAAERGGDPSGNVLVPGGIGGDSGFIAFFDEYFADPPAPFDPADSDSWPSNTRGASYIDYKVPVNQQINVESVEVKVSISGAPEDLDFLKINLTSPNGMQSELNHYYWDPEHGAISLQQRSEPAQGWGISTFGDLSDSGTFVWTFSTNRSWGESTNSAVIVNPVTGEPQAGPSATIGSSPLPIFRDWELHLENWSTSPLTINGVEIVWHGKPIAGGQIDQDWRDFNSGWEVPVAQRIQGIIGIDVDSDDEFSGIDPSRDNEWNNRYIQRFTGDLGQPRQTDLVRRILDDYEDKNNNGVFDAGDVREMEPYAANILVEAFEFTVDSGGNDIVNPQPIAQFLTGADGNYYFDLLPGNYIIRATDRNDITGTFIDDPNAPTGSLQHYKDKWRITEDWFYAPDHDVPIDIDNDGIGDIPGEINYDSVAQAPLPFRFDSAQPRIPMAVKDLNFLLKPEDTPTLNVQVSGTVYADVNGNGAVDIFDGAAASMRVYVDSIRNGQFDPGEQFVYTDAAGKYSLTVLAAQTTVVAIGVDLQPGWQPSIPGGDVLTLLVEPGTVLTNQNFFINPPDDPTGSGLGNITGFVFNDVDGDAVRDLNEGGIGSMTVFIDVNANGILDNGEVAVLTSANGAYFIPNLTTGTYRVDVVTGQQQMTTPAAGYQSINLASGETRIGVAFGLKNLAYRDFGDLPDSFDVAGTPSHVVVNHFRLGEGVTGDIQDLDSPNADLDDLDDGVEIVSNGGKLQPGENIFRVQTFGAGGQLVGWIDWDGLGSFDANDRLTFINHTTGENLGTEANLPPTGLAGILLRVVADDDFAANENLAMRFRWGEVGLTLSSQAIIGEVEDYFAESTEASPPTFAGDFNDDSVINAADYVAFRKFFGTSFVLPNTTNPGAPLVAADETLWRTNFGSTDPGSSPVAGSAPIAVPPAESPTVSPMVLGPQNRALSLATGTQEADDRDSAIGAGASTTPIFVGSGQDASPIAANASTTAHAKLNAVASSARSYADALLLLDQAIAELDESDVDAPLADRKADAQDYDDLALAAAFEDESSWWSL